MFNQNIDSLEKEYHLGEYTMKRLYAELELTKVKLEYSRAIFVPIALLFMKYFKEQLNEMQKLQNGKETESIDK